MNSGTGSHTEFWMLSSSECPSAAGASSLSDILEGGRLPRRYFLSAKACAGILRRAEKRARALPPLLRTALERVAATLHQAQSGHLIPFGGNNTSGPIDVATACNAHGGAGRMDFETETICVEVAHTLRGEGMDASEDGTGRGVPILPVGFSCKDAGGDAMEDAAPTLRAMGHKASHPNAGGQLAVAFRGFGQDGFVPREIAPPVLASDGGTVGPPVVFESRFARNGRGGPEIVTPPLKAHSGGSGRGDGAPLLATCLAVRRLTPRECERLQGFPDDHTLIPNYRQKLRPDEVAEIAAYLGVQLAEAKRLGATPDGPRYKAIGNSHGSARDGLDWRADRPRGPRAEGGNRMSLVHIRTRPVRVLLLQLDGKLPNLALMRIAAHHRERGDELEIRHGAQFGGLFDQGFDRVYASAIFERTRPLAQRVLATYPQAVIGGTGWDVARTIEDIGITTERVDYSIYPDYRHSIGFTQRGCRLKCPFCVVPAKEGRVRAAAKDRGDLARRTVAA